MHPSQAFSPGGAALVCSLSLLLSACATAPVPPSSAAAVPEVQKGSGYLIGYLAPEALPRSEAFLP